MIACLAIGAILLLAGILLSTVPLDHGTVSQWNGLCSSGIGQLGQMLSSSARSDCGKVALADHAIGWLFGLGIAGLAVGTVLAVTRARPGTVESSFSSAQPGPYATASQVQGPDNTAGLPAADARPDERWPGRWPAWWRSRTAAIVAVAVVAAAAGAWIAVSATAGSGGGLESFLCWNGPGDTGAALLQWTAGATVNGTYHEASLTGTAPNEQTSTGSSALTGTINGTDASFDFGGSGQIYGKLTTDLVLNVPQQDGTIRPETCKPGSTGAWNRAIADLRTTAASNNQAALQQQQQQQQQQQISQAQSSLASDVATLTQDASAQQRDKTLADDIQAMSDDLATEEQDYATEQSDSCLNKGGDAGVVDGDAGVVDGDLGSLQGDISALRSGAMQSIRGDLAAVNSDVNTLQSLGAVPAIDPSVAIALGKKTLSDSRKAITWALQQGQTLDSQAHQISHQADSLANC
jgi:hypothetical protein